MVIHNLSVSHFRNLSQLKTEFSPDINIFHGWNGSGKTNLLEAVFVLCLGRSQRGAQDALLLEQGEEVYRLEGSVEAGGRAGNVAVAYQKGSRKKVSIDDVPVRMAELYERFCAVSSGPEDSAVLSGPPSVRRGFVDIYLSQISGKYLANLSDYQRALAQKNAALKQEMDPAPFDPLLITIGTKIMSARLEFIKALRELAVRYYHDISGGESLRMKYEPSVPLSSEDDTPDEIETAFQLKLEDRFLRERAAQTALVGPHRDELYFEINDFPARTHGSQGQWRTAAISLKLAMYDLLKERRGTAPVLLLDEIFAELDTERTTGLIDSFAGFSQLFLTTAAEPPDYLRERGRSYRIQHGMIEDIR